MPRLPLIIAFVLMASSACSDTNSSPSPPAIRVIDEAGILPNEDHLTKQLDELERSTGYQMVVATTPSLNGVNIAEASNNVARKWSVGGQRNDGVVLLVVPRDRRLRIRVGYGLSDKLPDDFCNDVVQNRILPRIRLNDLPGGVAAGVDAIIDKLESSGHRSP